MIRVEMIGIWIGKLSMRVGYELHGLLTLCGLVG